MKFVLVLLACLVGLAQPSAAQQPTPDEFQRIRSHVINTGRSALVPGNLAQLLGWGTGRDVASLRISLDEKRNSDGKVMKRYGADVMQGHERVMLLIQQVPGDTTVCWLING